MAAEPIKPREQELCWGCGTVVAVPMVNGALALAFKV